MILHPTVPSTDMGDAMADLLDAQAAIKERRKTVRDRSGQFVSADVAAYLRARLLETTKELEREVYRGAAPVKRHIRHLHPKAAQVEGFL